MTHYDPESWWLLGSIVAFPNDAWSHRPGNSGAGEKQVCPSVGETTSCPPVCANEVVTQPADCKYGFGLLLANYSELSGERKTSPPVYDDPGRRGEAPQWRQPLGSRGTTRETWTRPQRGWWRGENEEGARFSHNCTATKSLIVLVSPKQLLKKLKPSPET